ncbi:MAG: Metal dependent phosphohydrolase [Candidatus Amesbacteria bacterium GW2011_GWA1_46_35]|nr:MAG: Metal dependent phosphohydrolase [Candidatus Amesbacteria bacterium GW2011_GWA1_46_35]
MNLNRDQAWKLLTEKMQNQNLRRHCLSVEVVMRALAKHFGGDEEKWGIVGLLSLLRKTLEITPNLWPIGCGNWAKRTPNY